MTERSPEIYRAAASTLRPPVDLLPSEFAAAHRELAVGTTFRPGKWSNEIFPYLVGVMDAAAEALATGRRGVCLMKAGQGGGSEAMINVVAWLKATFSGPMLYLISKDAMAKEFSRDRFAHIDSTCAPVAAKAISGYGTGSTLLQRRYVDGKITLAGGQSVLNFLSEPRRFVVVDELDTLMDEMPDGDPVKIAEIRTDAFPGQTLVILFGHPTTASRGVGKVYYERSDQRRAVILCPLCGVGRYWLQWAHVKVEPAPGQPYVRAERDPTAYVYRAPCCDGVLTDAARWSAVARGSKQESQLSPVEARKRAYIGVHFGQLYMSNKTLAFLAEEWIQGIEDPAIRRVFANKRMGDVFVADDGEEATTEVWGKLADHAEPYARGEFPPWVSYLTAGVDANSKHLHYAVWGWGLLATAAGKRVLCGALVDWAELEREQQSAVLDAADLEVLDQLLLRRRFARVGGESSLSVRQVYLDSGWQPIAVYEYCRPRGGVCVPVKGGSEDARGAADPIRWSHLPPYELQGHLINSGLQLAVLNTWRAKEQLVGLVRATCERVDEKTGEVLGVYPRLYLPHDVEESYLEQAGSEYKKRVGRRTVWAHRGPNHFADCNVYALFAAQHMAPLQRGKTAEELKHAEQRSAGGERARAPVGRRQAERRVRRSY